MSKDLNPILMFFTIQSKFAVLVGFQFFIARQKPRYIYIINKQSKAKESTQTLIDSNNAQILF